ncbi:hypothetical protein D7V94_20350 [Parablautia intestinalis]|uniref:SH3 domain-containing protein n=1 Tax=Parablautia intestinalis TaxID=2320100 RepID=A0A3A9AJV4_9FIRM|nr:hypothetical protein [Parablautia intestinalis]RKI87773.1 hypothetical protein D7V94_20350 [Parablautia intestinalis]
MKTLISHFFQADIRIRAAILIALFIMIFWWILGKVIIRLASFFPCSLKSVFRGIYLLIEAPVCWIHERVGSSFYEIDNGLSGIGKKIDTFLERWYTKWKNTVKSHIVLSIVIYGILLVWICVSHNTEGIDENSFNGQTVYLKVEDKLVDWLEVHNLYGQPIEEVADFEESEQEEKVALEEKGPVYIQLNERGKRGSNIRSETNLDNDANIIGGVNAESEILYSDEWTHDGERYWIRVYIPDDDVEGWLSGNLIEREQIEEITGESMHLSGDD